MTCMGERSVGVREYKMCTRSKIYLLRNISSQLGFDIEARLLSLSATIYFASQHAMSGNDVGA